MALSQKKLHPPPTCDSISTLITEAAKAISYTDDELFGIKRNWQEEAAVIHTLLQRLTPKDQIEALLATQTITLHLLGMRKLASSCLDDQKLGLKMLRFSKEALQGLEKKRSGSHQNITVNYISQPIEEK